MNNFKETQLQEIEALTSIYGSELKIINNEYPNIKIDIALSYNFLNGLKLINTMKEIRFQASLNEDYPNSPPIIECYGSEKNKFWTDLFCEAKKKLFTFANENLGFPMIFTLVAIYQDIIVEIVETNRAKANKIEDEKKELQERLEQVKFEGSRVTVEQFNKWNDKFLEELRLKKEEQINVERDFTQSKLTGKQLFLRDKSLNISDLKLINTIIQTNDVIDIDPTLFEAEIDEEDFSDGEKSS